jgi:hypothetical protein
MPGGGRLLLYQFLAINVDPQILIIVHYLIKAKNIPPNFTVPVFCLTKYSRLHPYKLVL